MIRFYVLPIQVVGTARGPKYFKWRYNPDGIDCQWSMKDYGLIPACLLAANITQGQHDALMLNDDVAAAPENIDATVTSAALPRVQTVLNALRIPAEWVTTSHTYRTLLRMVAGLCLFAQRYHGMHNEQLIDNAAALDLRWNQIPTARRGRIIATVDALGYDYSQVTNTWTVRRILKHLADQWGEKPVLFGFTTL